ncbi:MAG: hypothetical protein NC094_12135 [Bacteroidales bacterium]|nr:hypothetical protein [Lachnoclostridium sp.]MCM1385255.1 hypothetical protein [Lachnoclostridium sp.]MCM1466159.1 hypothetical protein [Bacteroidales bacterium]
MADYDGAIRIVTKITTRDAEESLASLEYTIKKSAKYIEELRSKMDALKGQKIPTQDYKKLQDELSKAEKELSQLVAKQTEWEEMGVTSGDAWDTLNEEIAKASDNVDLIKEKMQALSDTGKAFTLGENTSEYATYARQIEYEEQAIIKAGEHYNKLLAKVPKKFDNMKKSAQKAFNAINSGTKKSSGLLSTFSSRMKGLALSLLIFNQISKAFRAMISGMKQGFTNFMGYSDSYAQSVQNMKNAMTTLENQFAAAFAPIVQMVIPWLNSLINTLTTAMSKVAQFIAVLSGKNTFTKAKKIQDSYNKSLDGTAKSADKARGALAAFDDLDVLDKKEDASGGTATETLPEDMFEEVPIDAEVVGWLDDIIERLNTMKSILVTGFFDGLGDTEGRIETIKNGFASIQDSLKEIWTDPSVMASADAWAQSTVRMLGTVAGSIASIGLTIGANLIGGFSKFLEKNKENIKNRIVKLFDIRTKANEMISETFKSIAYIFEGFASENGQEFTSNILGIFDTAFGESLVLISQYMNDILNIFTLPFIENKEAFREALEGFLGTLAEVSGTIKEGIDETFAGLNEVYEEHVSPFYNSIAQGISDLTGTFLNFWNGSVQPILDSWAAKFDEVWTAHIQPMLNKCIELLGNLADFLKTIWEVILQPFINWIIENILPTILPIYDNIVSGIMEVLGYIGDAIGGIVDIFNGMLEFLVGVFTGDWDKAWSGITKIVEGVRDTIKGIINAILGFLEMLVNNFIGGVNSIIHTLEELASIKNPFTGEVIWQLDLPEIPTVSLPRLATGAVIRGGNPFMAVLGDQPAGQTNIEAPLATIKQAVREELAGLDLGNGSGGTLKVVLNVNGEDLARATLSDFLSEMSRQGYDVDVLGVT